ncbi:MAG: hypothetical protein ACFFGZ_10545 [Candidatus Thorarchaeota archaeon]
MKVAYRYYEPNQGLEELQARIYTEASGLPASAEDIRARYKDQKKDPKTTLYALTDDGEPLAYVQATDSTSHPGRTHMSYPWALASCPAEAQNKIFDDLLIYLKQRKETLQITIPLVAESKNIEERIQFLEKKGFAEKERLYYYFVDFNVTEISGWKLGEEMHSFTSRLATAKDVDHFIDVCQADPNYQFLTPEVATNYFHNRLLKDGRTILVFQNDLPVAIGAPLRFQPDGRIVKMGEGERIILRISATRTGYPHAWKRLLFEVSKECAALGWANIPLRTYFRFYASSTAAINLAEMRPEFEAFEYILAYGD